MNSSLLTNCRSHDASIFVVFSKRRKTWCYRCGRRWWTWALRKCDV